jgi:hypothetical protein
MNMESYAKCPVRKPGDTLLPEVVPQLTIPYSSKDNIAESSANTVWPPSLRSYISCATPMHAPCVAPHYKERAALRRNIADFSLKTTLPVIVVCRASQ